MSILRYYQEEARYLREAGLAFAEAHPDVAPMLGLHKDGEDIDPFVRLLFEGFAFMTGRLRETLDDELPAYTESLLELLHPQFLRPFPSATILAFAPKSGAVQDTVVLPRGTRVETEKLGDAGTRFRFRTTQEIYLQPIELEDVRMDWPGGAASSVTLKFQVEKGADLRSLNLQRMRLFLAGVDRIHASTMHDYLTRHVTSIEYSLPGTQVTLRREGQKWIVPAGLTEDESLAPRDNSSFSGFHLLQEYFCFPQKFWFVDLKGLEILQSLETEVSRFEVKIHFDDSFPRESEIGPRNVRLYCSPAVNLFEANAKAITLDDFASTYRLVASESKAGEMIYDVLSVEGLARKGKRSQPFSSLYDFKHLAQKKGEYRNYYSVSSRPGLDEAPEMFLTIGSADEHEDIQSEFGTLLVKTLNTNGRLPQKEFKAGMKASLASGERDVATVVNLSDAGRLLFAPTDLQKQYFWRLISHLSLNFSSVIAPDGRSADRLVSVLDLYEWRRSRANRQRLEAIQAVELCPDDMLIERAIVRGSELKLTIARSGFTGRGDIALFGLVLSRFFAAYASLNSFVKLAIDTVPENPQEPEMVWGYSPGQMHLL